jgi:hypothetical protein
MTKKFNRGSKNQNSPRRNAADSEFVNEIVSGDNSKGNKYNKDQKDKTDSGK